MKKIFITITVISMFLGGVYQAMAVTLAPTPTIIQNSNQNLRVNTDVTVRPQFDATLTMNYKEQALNSVDKLLNGLDSIIPKIENNQILSNQEKTKILSKIRQYRLKLKEYRIEANGIPNLTENQFNSIKSRTRTTWRNATNEITKSIIDGRITERRGELNKARILINKIEVYLNLAKDKGARTDGIESDLAQMKVYLINTENELNKAEELLSHVEETTTKSIARGYFQDSNKALKNVNDNLKAFKNVGENVIKDLQKLTW